MSTAKARIKQNRQKLKPVLSFGSGEGLVSSRTSPVLSTRSPMMLRKDARSSCSPGVGLIAALSAEFTAIAAHAPRPGEHSANSRAQPEGFVLGEHLS